eukprot:TRINITY_DN9239_c0_g1_i1.p1 TRINITY_DN9239_c0_g1~~TRINITY_DN9239_c0_g1_i1.p1  ORF type:complete len:403 (-),score=118.82 TRINITY_DN9239_c0_g1_i1:177-1385(-)
MNKKTANEEEKTLSSDEKKLLKKIEQGEVELSNIARASKISNDPKHQVYTDMGYEVHPKEGLVYRDADSIARQRKAVLQLIKTLGSAILQGKSLMNISMPVIIFDKCTVLQRAATNFAYAPIYMERIYATDDPVEKMKNAVAFYIAGLHLNLTQKKPFNPIWGETYQGRIGDDADVYCEQVSHHPAVSYVYVDAPHYNLMAKDEYTFKVYPNSATLKCTGYRKIIMKDKDKTTYIIRYPWVESRGFMFGLPVFTYNGDIVVEDTTNELYAMVRLNAGKKSFTEGFFKKNDERNDFFKGLITKSKELTKETGKKAFYSKEMISYIEGHWIDYVMIDGDMYWELNREKPLPVVDVKDPLPSDSSFREDLKNFIVDNEAESQKQKEILENVQRNDRKLREAYNKK